MSLTILGLIATVIGLVLTPDETDAIMSFIDQGIIVFGIVATYWGRYRKGDLTWYGTRN